MYESPIKLFQTMEVHSGLFDAEKDKLIYNAVQGVGVDVDKKELEKALIYDRQQYEKGYREGRKEVIENLIKRLNMNSFIISPDLVFLSDIINTLEEMMG